MVLTEKNTAAKTCPVSRGAPIDESHPYMGTRPCVGSSCMAWRWYDPTERWEDGHKRRVDERRGYCGLAGKPEHV
jgi:hypothetical protein